ncbi:MAG TPA: hypothetical protein VGL91_25520 [Acidobacteriota bacterium]
MRKVFFRAHVILVVAALLVSSGSAQSQDNRGQTTAAGTQNSKPSGISRWLEIPSLSINARYRFIQTTEGVTTTSHLQYRDSVVARFKFDEKGRYSLNAGMHTGTTFISGWDASGWGRGGQGITNHYLKQLYFSAKPIKGLELQYGGFSLLRGESTEATTYDNDGYIVGQRVSLKRPKDFFFDEISVTYAYLGDSTKPNLNKRFSRLKKSNYHQFLLSKKISPRATVSADYTFQSGIETLRQAVTFNVPELRLIDRLRFENYQRVDVLPAYGFFLYGERRIFDRATVGGGYASIDRNYSVLNTDRFQLNADKFQKGSRLYLMGSYDVHPCVTVSAYWLPAVANDYALANQQHFQLVVSYDLAKALGMWEPFKPPK